MDLDRGDLGGQRLGDARRDLGRVVVAVEARHHRHARPLGAAQQVGERAAGGLAGDVPKRHVDRGQGIEVGPGAAERREANPRFDVQALALLHRFAEEERRDDVADRGDQAFLHGRPQAQALAIADQPGTGRHLAKDEMQRVGGSRRLGNPQSDRVYAIDDHALSCALRKTKGMPVPPSIDEAELDAMLKRAGLTLTADQVKGLLPGADDLPGHDRARECAAAARSRARADLRCGAEADVGS